LQGTEGARRLLETLSNAGKGQMDLLVNLDVDVQFLGRGYDEIADSAQSS
jgi:hypothetical protein